MAGFRQHTAHQVNNLQASLSNTLSIPGFTPSIPLCQWVLPACFGDYSTVSCVLYTNVIADLRLQLITKVESPNHYMIAPTEGQLENLLRIPSKIPIRNPGVKLSYVSKIQLETT